MPLCWFCQEADICVMFTRNCRSCAVNPQKKKVIFLCLLKTKCLITFSNSTVSKFLSQRGDDNAYFW